MTSPTYLRRFDAYDRVLHVLLMVSFLGLAGTGLPLLFSDTAWARHLANFLGGFEVAGWLHRVSALLLIVVFAIHIFRIARRVIGQRDVGLLWGPRSMVPQLRDLRDLVQHVLWFIGQGPKPRFDQFTYWEKFDYWAVFWGMFIIGGSGLLLWFPVFFARFVPGWIFNIALLIHGEEALLAVGFIFTIHFFNTHLRPEKFPIDRVIFTGRVTLDEMREERPDEYARLTREGTLPSLSVSPPDPWLGRFGTVVAATAVPLGLALVGLILYAVLTK
jgi:cytochrome b subunit of formate dehydrogenase